MTTDNELASKMHEFLGKHERKIERLRHPLREAESAREKLVMFGLLLKGYTGGNRAGYIQLKRLRDEIRQLTVDVDEALALEKKRSHLNGESRFGEAAFSLVGAGLRDWTFLDLVMETATFELSLNGIAPESALWHERQSILDSLNELQLMTERNTPPTREPLDRLTESMRIFQRQVQLVQAEIRANRLAVRLTTGRQEYYDQARDLYAQVDKGTLTREQVEEQLCKTLLPGLHPLDGEKEAYLKLLMDQPPHLNNNKSEGTLPARK
jgi:hypothetical protein